MFIFYYIFLSYVFSIGIIIKEKINKESSGLSFGAFILSPIIPIFILLDYLEIKQDIKRWEKEVFEKHKDDIKKLEEKMTTRNFEDDYYYKAKIKVKLIYTKKEKYV